MKTRAAILVEQHQPLVVDDVELPAVALGQVLVELKTSRICGSQIGEIDGVKGPDRYLPHLLGHEGGGAGPADKDPSAPNSVRRNVGANACERSLRSAGDWRTRATLRTRISWPSTAGPKAIMIVCPRS